MLWDLGIGAVNLFGYSEEKDDLATPAYDPNGVIQRAVAALKEALPNLCVQTDVALDPYTNHGHDGLLREGYIVNDETLEVLVRQALVQVHLLADLGRSLVSDDDPGGGVDLECGIAARTGDGDGGAHD